jgi:hypothetical protein
MPQVHQAVASEVGSIKLEIAMNKILRFPALTGLALIFAISACDNPTESDAQDDNNKIIEISMESYNQYGAVWFSPTTGEIVGIVGFSETPPETKFIYWIEPSDPEFQTWLYDESQDTYGIKFVGIGDSYFDSTTTSSSDGFAPDLFEVGTFETNSVFFFRAENGDCLIQIIDWQQDEAYLKFKWRLL